MGQEIQTSISQETMKTSESSETFPTTEKEGVIYPHEYLPKPEAPPGLNGNVLISFPANNFSVELSAIGKYLIETKDSLSAALSRRLSLDDVVKGGGGGDAVTEFYLSGIQVVVREKELQNEGFAFEKSSELTQLKGRVTLFSKSNCRDSSAARKILREKGLKYSEINIDVYPVREKELIDRTGGSTVPQIFFNEKLIGGLVALNSLRNSGLLDRTAKELLGSKCPDDAPAAPVYGFDEPEEERPDEMGEIVKILRVRLPIQDRIIRMRMVNNCFTGTELVDCIVHHSGTSRTEAIKIAKEIVRKHFIHHVFRGNYFEDGNVVYRFLEHEQFVSKCFNFRGSIDDKEPESAARIGEKLMKIMSAILESYASEDRCRLDYLAISNSEEFRRYVNMVRSLHRVDLFALSLDEKLAFFLNLYNAMVIHAVIRRGYPEGMIERKSFVSDFQYIVGGHSYSLNAIRNGILRSNQRAPYALVKPFSTGDNRLQMSLPMVNLLIHFGLCDGSKSSPSVRFFSPQNVQAELRFAAREYFKRIAIEVDLSKRTVSLPCIMKWYSSDFGIEKEGLKWMLSYLDAGKAGLLSHLLDDGGVINIVYQNYDWSINV
ncbi:uncharacterized protein LOC130823651 isoform X2 [Amaranthus tricolor]|uniref:uncharacterized protein LOC130823651 isoform X2 n=1 Tax=Amaranthus tricolor TaxID=29722 RepID=UPI0025876814|nr:uncharacterized protein LOC130823651 isoform X2 [Amaranthus tricolor]